MLQPDFGQVNVPLDAAQDFVADDTFVAELDDGPAFLIERDVRKAFVFGGKKAERGVGALRFDRFQLADVVFVFDAEAFQGVGLFRNVFENFFQFCQRGLVGLEAGDAFFFFKWRLIRMNSNFTKKRSSNLL